MSMPSTSQSLGYTLLEFHERLHDLDAGQAIGRAPSGRVSELAAYRDPEIYFEAIDAETLSGGDLLHEVQTALKAPLREVHPELFVYDAEVAP
jgi:hypothetical protein